MSLTSVRASSWARLADSRAGPLSRLGGPPGHLALSPALFPVVTSPSRGSARNIRRPEERKADPLGLEGYTGSALLPKPPERGPGECGPRRGTRQLSSVQAPPSTPQDRLSLP